MADFPGPFDPDELARAQAYYGGAALSSSAAAPPPPAESPADYYGPPIAPPVVAPPAAVAPPPAPLRPVGAQLSQIGDPQGRSLSFLGAAQAPPPASPPPTDAAGNRWRPYAPKPEAPAPPAGPTPGDDKEFAAFRRLQDTKKPASGGGKGGGSPANPDPYGVKGAQSKYLGSFSDEAAAIRRGVDAEGERNAMAGEAHGALAQLQQKDALIRERELADAQAGFDTHMGEAQKQIDEVRAKKIDPQRLMQSDGMVITAILGGVFGGLYQGINKLDKNPFLEDLNRHIDRDMAAQEKDISNEQQGVTNKMNVLREQRATFKDNDLAKLQTRSLMYAATEEAIKAEAAKFDSPIAQAHADQAVAAVERERAKNDLQIKTQAEHAANARAAAGAAAARAQALEARKAFGDTYEKHIAAGSSPAVAEAEANRMVQNLFQGGAGARPEAATGASADPLANVPKSERSEATKELREHSDREHAKQALSTAYSNFLSAGVTDRSARDAFRAQARGILKPHMKGANSDVDMDQLINPLIPEGGFTTDAAQGQKLKAATALLDAEGTTPLLDRHAPGWKGPAPVKQYGTDGKPR